MKTKSYLLAPVKIALLAVLTIPLLQGCTTAKPPTASSVSTQTPPAETEKLALPVVSPKSPGPYTTVMADQAQMRQGRYADGQFSGQLVRSTIGDPKVFNPWTAADTNSAMFAGHMFSALINVDPYTGNLFPDMAESYTVAPDGVTYTIKLRKGLLWSDDQPITAKDVVFTWNTIVAGGYGNASMKDGVSVEGKIPQITQVNGLTVKFVTSKPFAPFLRALSNIAIAPQHVIEPITKKSSGREDFNQLWSANLDPKTLVTCGPFRLTRYVPAQRVEFEPATNYYMVNAGKKRLPYLRKLVYLIVADASTNLLKFKAAEIDITQVRNRDVAELFPTQEKQNFKLYNLGPSAGSTFFMVNMNQRKDPKTDKPYVEPIKSVWFNDTNFRQAMNHAINRDHVIQDYLKGLGSAQFAAESITSPFHDKSLKAFDPDLNMANALLKKSGFTKKQDGILYDKNDNKVEFTLYAPAGDTFFAALANEVVADLKELGIKIDYQEVELKMLSDKLQGSLDWEGCLFSLSGSDNLEPANSANVYKTDGRLHIFDLRSADSKGNIDISDARAWEKRIDVLFDKGATTLDSAERHKLYDEYQRIIYDQAPFIFTVEPTTVVAARNTIQNYDPTPLAQLTNGLHNLEEIWKKDK